MLEELTRFHQDTMASIDQDFRRYLYNSINWSAKAICIYGARGVGKTTLLCQYFLQHYKTADKALYITADNIHVAANGLLTIASDYFALGGEALFIDEVHKYPNWSIELKNIIDTYRNKQIIFSSSSTMDLHSSKADLSRRVVYHNLPGMSFREYLKISQLISIDPISFEEIMTDHVKLADQFKTIPILKHFQDYLRHGYYPYFLENIEGYLLKINNVIEKVLTEDIAQSKSLKPATIMILKKLLWLVATSTCLAPNIDRISRNLGASRELIYSGFEYLQQADLINTVYANVHGLKLIRKPGKIFMENTNLLHAINGTLKLESDTGSIRETFFVNQLAVKHKINSHDQSDFIVDEKYVFEIGGKKKNDRQIKSIPDALLALDGIPIGFGNRVPLYLFGLLY